MTTKLDGVLKRELRIGREDFTLTLSTESFTLAAKGRRKGLTIAWVDLVSGDAALANALNASLTSTLEPTANRTPKLRVVSQKPMTRAKSPARPGRRLPK